MPIGHTGRVLAACSSGDSNMPTTDPITDAPSTSENPSVGGDTTGGDPTGGDTTLSFDSAANLQDLTATFVNDSP